MQPFVFNLSTARLSVTAPSVYLAIVPSGISQYSIVAGTLLTIILDEHFEGIIAHATFNISAGRIEGINNKIKTLRRKGYGYPDDDYFFLKLFDVKYSIVNENPVEANTKPTVTVSVTLSQLSLGSKGNAVKNLQMLLNGYGASCGTADGDFGSKTDKAVKTYQTAKKLTADGIVGAQTWSALLNG